MPFPNEHSARITNPKQYTKFARQNIDPGIDIILGIKAGKSEKQAVRFDKNKFTAAQAKAWLKEHKIKYISFEPAKESKALSFSREDLQEYQNDKKTYEIKGKEVFAAGLWKGFKYTVKHLDEIVATFNELKERKDIPLRYRFKQLVLGHDKNQRVLQNDGYPAAGYIKSLKRIGNKIVADFKDIPRLIKEFIERKAYKGVSSEVWHNWTDGATGKKYPLMLSAVGLLGADIPAVTGLNDWGKFYDEETDDKNICNFGTEGDEIKYEFLDDAEGLENPEGDPEGDPEDKNKKLKEEAEAMELKELQDKFDKLEGKVKGLEVENKKLKEDKDTSDKKLSEKEIEARDKEIKETVDKLKKEGKILPAQEAEITNVLQSMDDSKEVTFKDGEGKDHKGTPRQAFVQTLTSLPKRVEFDEKSQTIDTEKVKVEHKGEYSEESENLDAYAKELMKKNDKMTYEDALSIVSKEHPELTEETSK